MTGPEMNAPIRKFAAALSVAAATAALGACAGALEAQTDPTSPVAPRVQALVEANRASFAIDSALNQGTLVKITFPTTRVLAG